MGAQVVAFGVIVLSRALPQAYAKALQNAKKSGGAAASSASESILIRNKLQRSEALQILNLTEEEATIEAIQKQYDRYFAANDVKSGGSFYLQSKIYRSKELLDQYIKEKRAEEKLRNEEQAKNSNEDSKNENR